MLPGDAPGILIKTQSCKLRVAQTVFLRPFQIFDPCHNFTQRHFFMSSAVNAELCRNSGNMVLDLLEELRIEMPGRGPREDSCRKAPQSKTRIDVMLR
jgi:hypothetical protein